MTLKEATANSLLMFVAATCVVLIVKAVSPVPQMPPAIASANRESGTLGAASSGTPTLAMQDGYKVYYLHGNFRCTTCRTIEANAKEAVETGFGEELQSGRVEWQVINYDAPGNERYALDYEVVAPTVVVAKYEGGKQLAWKGLPGVWEYVGDTSAFIEYVQTELRNFMAGSPSQVSEVSVTSSPDPSSSESLPFSLPIPE